jgi:hypothetical protein
VLDPLVFRGFAENFDLGFVGGRVAGVFGEGPPQRVPPLFLFLVFVAGKN